MDNKLWENIAYINIGLCLIANITIGYFYMFAQILYLLCNLTNVFRNIFLKRSIADKIRDIAFLGVTIGLIIIRLIQY